MVDSIHRSRADTKAFIQMCWQYRPHHQPGGSAGSCCCLNCCCCNACGTCIGSGGCICWWLRLLPADSWEEAGMLGKPPPMLWLCSCLLPAPRAATPQT